MFAAHPSTTMAMLQSYVNVPTVHAETKEILQREIESRHEMAGDDVVCKTALVFWRECPISGEYVVNPARATDNHVYEEAYIKEWLSRNRLIQ